MIKPYRDAIAKIAQAVMESRATHIGYIPLRLQIQQILIQLELEIDSELDAMHEEFKKDVDHDGGHYVFYV